MKNKPRRHSWNPETLYRSTCRYCGCVKYPVSGTRMWPLEYRTVSGKVSSKAPRCLSDREVAARARKSRAWTRGSHNAWLALRKNLRALLKGELKALADGVSGISVCDWGYEGQHSVMLELKENVRIPVDYLTTLMRVFHTSDVTLLTGSSGKSYEDPRHDEFGTPACLMVRRPDLSRWDEKNLLSFTLDSRPDWPPL